MKKLFLYPLLIALFILGIVLAGTAFTGAWGDDADAIVMALLILVPTAGFGLAGLVVIFWFFRWLLRNPEKNKDREKERMETNSSREIAIAYFVLSTLSFAFALPIFAVLAVGIWKAKRWAYVSALILAGIFIIFFLTNVRGTFTCEGFDCLASPIIWALGIISVITAVLLIKNIGKTRKVNVDEFNHEV